MTFFLFLIPPNFGLFGNHGFWSTVCIFLFRWCWWIPELFFLTCIRCWMCLKGSNKSLRKTHTHTHSYNRNHHAKSGTLAPRHLGSSDHPRLNFFGSLFQEQVTWCNKLWKKHSRLWVVSHFFCHIQSPEIWHAPKKNMWVSNVMLRILDLLCPTCLKARLQTGNKYRFLLVNNSSTVVHTMSRTWQLWHLFIAGTRNNRF